MTARMRIICMVCGLVITAACDRTPPMSVVQSPAEFNCLAAVEEASGSGEVTLLALARTASGAEAQVLAREDGTSWTCRTNVDGQVLSVVRGLGAQ